MSLPPPSPPPSDRSTTSPPSQVTALLGDLSEGRRGAIDELFPLIYDDLKRIARNHLKRERGGHTLNTTVLVHESYLNLVDGKTASVRDRAHFFALASRVMRNILVDRARARGAAKRGGEHVRVPLTPESASTDAGGPEMLDLHRALERLGERDERLERVVECKVFGGMTTKETADAVGIGVRTVEKDWTVAKAFLHRELQPS